MATAPAATRRDLRKLLRDARSLDMPLIIGSTDSAPHVEATLALIRDIARSEGLSCRLAILRADIDRSLLELALRESRISALDGMSPVTEGEIDDAAHIVGQMGSLMGSLSFRRALGADIAALIAGRSCDPAIFAALPMMLGFPPGPAMHMAKIIECASLCWIPGGRDAILATLDDDGFELESMAPQRSATPVSVAAHSLYEQADPYTLREPGGTLDLSGARYTALDDRRTRVGGAIGKETTSPSIKPAGARQIGERAILLAGAADPHFIAPHQDILRAASAVVRELVCEDAPEDYTLGFRVYGVDGARMAPPTGAPPSEVFVLGKVIAPTAERAAEAMRTTKQYLLHLGYPGRLSTAGNLAFPFTPPEISVGLAYRFTVYHLLHTPDPDACLFLRSNQLGIDRLVRPHTPHIRSWHPAGVIVHFNTAPRITRLTVTDMTDHARFQNRHRLRSRLGLSPQRVPLAGHHEVASPHQRRFVHPPLLAIWRFHQPPDIKLAQDLDRHTGPLIDPVDRIAGARPCTEVDDVGAQGRKTRQRQPGHATLVEVDDGRRLSCLCRRFRVRS